MKDLLGKKYSDAIDLMQSYWYNERPSNNMSLMSLSSDTQVMVVYATQFDPEAGYEYGCALPDQQIKAENRYNGGNYTVDIRSYSHDTYVSNIPINEVGPWNVNDDYWHPNRRYYTGLALGDPEAARAYFEGYNNGLDDIGRIITNPAGIDLTPEVAAQLGFGTNESGYVTIYLNNFN